MYKSLITRIIFCLFALVLVHTPVSAATSAPTEVIADVSYVKKGGVRGIQINFALPVHYVSHFPTKHGKSLNINLNFNRQEVPDTSQLPLLQSLTPPPSRFIPITELTYLTENDQPKLVVKFGRDVKYSVSQLRGATSLVIFLPESFKSKSTLKSTVELPSIIPSKIKGKVTKSRTEKMYRKGRKALQKSDNRTAIQIFSALLSIPEHGYSQESLELLGLARERNGQNAHAKAAYSEYLEKYKEGKDAARVKQRLADLLVSRKKPKKRLKNRRKDDDKEEEYRSTLFASVTQLLQYSGSKVVVDDGEPVQQTDSTSVDSSLSVNWRIRSGNYDIRNFFYGNYDYDTLNKETDGFELSTMYSKLKNSRAGVYLTLGRQSAQSTGILSRFDGLLFGYDLTEKIRFNIASGYPVLLTEKSEIQTDKLFNSVNLEFNDLFKSWDISPYAYQQDINGLTNRSAIGAEVRFFHDKGDFFGLYDRDTNFDTTNIVLMRGKYIFKKNTSIRVNYDKRHTPSLELERVLVGLNPERIETVDDIFGVVGANYTEEDLKQKAFERTGDSKLITLGISHSFSDVLHLTIDRSSSQSTTPTVIAVTIPGDLDQSVIDTLEAPLETSFRKSNDFSIQMVTSQSFYRRDSTIFSFRGSRANNNLTDTLSLEYRWPYSNKMRMNVRLQARNSESYIDDATGRRTNTLKRITPTYKFNYRATKKLRIFGEFSYEINDGELERGTGAVNDTSEQVFSGFVGYTWDI